MEVKRGLRNSMCMCRPLGMTVNGRLYEGVVVQTAWYGVEIWNAEAAERRLNVVEMRCLKSL